MPTAVHSAVKAIKRVAVGAISIIQKHKKMIVDPMGQGGIVLATYRFNQNKPSGA